MMVQSATGRRVPPGKLPADVGCVVMNVASVAFIARYIKTGKPLVSRSLTVDGSAIGEPKTSEFPSAQASAKSLISAAASRPTPARFLRADL